MLLLFHIQPSKMCIPSIFPCLPTDYPCSQMIYECAKLGTKWYINLYDPKAGRTLLLEFNTKKILFPEISIHELRLFRFCCKITSFYAKVVLKNMYTNTCIQCIIDFLELAKKIKPIQLKIFVGD